MGNLAYVYPDGGSALVPVTASGLGSPGSIDWTAIHGVGYRVFITGSSNQIVEVKYDGTFERVYDASARLRAFGGSHPGELFAAGGATVVRFNGQSWSSAPSFSPGFNLFDLTAVDPNLYYAVGIDQGGGAQIFRGRR